MALARALVFEPQLVLMDEPLGALDKQLREHMQMEIKHLHQRLGVTVVYVTHDQGEALSFADQLAVMRQGCLVQAGQPMALYLHPRDEQTALFLGEAVLMPARIENGWAECDLGRIAVNHQGRSKTAQIMLRPEQLQVSPASPDGTGCRGVITERDFGGNTCTLSVTLVAGTLEPGRSLPVHCPGLMAPAIGSAVKLTTVGQAHVLKS